MVSSHVCYYFYYASASLSNGSYATDYTTVSQRIVYEYAEWKKFDELMRSVKYIEMTVTNQS